MMASPGEQRYDNRMPASVTETRENIFELPAESLGIIENLRACRAADSEHREVGIGATLLQDEVQKPDRVVDAPLDTPLGASRSRSQMMFEGIPRQSLASCPLDSIRWNEKRR